MTYCYSHVCRSVQVMANLLTLQQSSRVELSFVTSSKTLKTNVVFPKPNTWCVTISCEFYMACVIKFLLHLRPIAVEVKQSSQIVCVFSIFSLLTRRSPPCSNGSAFVFMCHNLILRHFFSHVALFHVIFF